jgi:NAD(P)H-flavin reductase
MFSGPHGQSIAMEKYETVLMVASGFGIAAQLPYLKRLIHGYNSREVFARRIHLVWQIEDKGKTVTNLAHWWSSLQVRDWNRGSVTAKWCAGGG